MTEQQELEAANDSYEDELLAHVQKFFTNLKPRQIGMAMTAPLSDGRRWTLMPMDAYERHLKISFERGKAAALKEAKP